MTLHVKGLVHKTVITGSAVPNLFEFISVSCESQNILNTVFILNMDKNGDIFQKILCLRRKTIIHDRRVSK